MANQIRVTPDELRNTANSLRRCALSIENDLADTQKAIDMVIFAWSGDAMNKYFETIHSKMKDTTELATALNALASSLEEAARRIEATESQIAALFRL